MAWACALAGCMVITMAAVFYKKDPPPLPPPVDITPVLSRLDRVEAWIHDKDATASRCYSVEKMDLTIYPVPNVGVRKVAR